MRENYGNNRPDPAGDVMLPQKAVKVADDFTTCGIGKFRPKCLQVFARANVYFVFFCILGIIQGAYFTYFIGVLSTLEKRFSFDSKISGVIMISDNLSPILTSLLIGYYGGQAHRPRIISCGMLVVVLSCLLSTLPYVLYGPGKHLTLISDSTNTNRSKHEFCDAIDTESTCGLKDSPTEKATVPAVVLLFFANFLNGFGSTAYYTVGTTYLDDSVPKKSSPMYFGVMGALRLVGPALGFLLSSYCLSFYEDITDNPGFGRTDPRFVGAWWLGFLILGGLIFIFTIPMCLFPRQLPRKNKNLKPVEKEPPLKLRGLPKAVMSLVKNQIFFCHSIGITFRVIGYLGYYMFKPKYMESQFRQSASGASLISGSTSLVTMIIGVLVGGIIVKKFKPRARILSGYIVIVEILSIIFLLSSMFMGCPLLQMDGNLDDSGSWNLYNDCNTNCTCSRRVFQPTCGQNGQTTFFSPCFAGCTAETKTADGLKFLNCKCGGMASEGQLIQSPISTASSGYCEKECTMFLPYIIILSLSKMISSTARVGNTIITLRCVSAKEKSLALGVIGTMLSIFAFIPYPLIYGALTDAACKVWEMSCGVTGNCWLYDADKFRYYLHGASLFFIILGTLFDIRVFCLSGRLKHLYDDEDEELFDNQSQKSGVPLRDRSNVSTGNNSAIEDGEDIIFIKTSRGMP